ncbi:PAS domain-containing protein [Methanohalobium sp.]|uniref:PAS domain-containing protein n=1 Tax=Methanohalobium sp. TaxID=2837493 RepID=UPI0025CD83A1|nr:PAS domain-containing protein [Methanohalobium sp.]
MFHFKEMKLALNLRFDTMLKTSGFYASFIKGKDDFDLFPEKEAKKYRSDDSSVMESGEPVYNLEETYTTSEGENGWALTSKVPYFDSEGNVIGIVGSSLDITERKQMYENLYKSKKKEKEIILNSTSEHITYQDLNHSIKWCNRAVTNSLRVDYNDIVGQRCYKL